MAVDKGRIVLRSMPIDGQAGTVCKYSHACNFWMLICQLTQRGHMNSYRSSINKFNSVQTIVTNRHPTQGKIVVWTDGACEPNPGYGGWGYQFEDGPSDCGGARGTTNNRMELEAILQAIAANKDAPLIVRTDSQLCVLCAVGRWKRKKNHDQWMRLHELCRDRIVIFEWWRGHIGTPGNERADELAAIGRGTLIEVQAMRAKKDVLQLR